MITFKIKDEHIKLGQLLKAAGLSESGVDAKFAVQDGLVKVNGETEMQRGKKIFPGDIVEFNGEKVQVTGSDVL
ncbi:MAG: RNA-binding S4 domain-containing protein [Lachnospiraceae bacterium]|nr:RNA-binding S4 domain-containing protein [Lachnospiraceae bacterium]